jgi:amino acid transporter
MLSTLGDGLITLSCVASTIAFANYGARVIATAAHDGLLPMWMAKIHIRHKSPHVAVMILGVLAAMLPTAVALSFHTSPIELTTHMTNMMVYIWLVPYAVICVGAIRLQLKAGRWNTLGLACGAVGTCGCVFLMAHAVHTSRGPTRSLATAAYGLMAVTIAVCWWTSRRTRRITHGAAHTPAGVRPESTGQ